VFKWLAREGGVADLEMLRTFNCGIGMVAVAAADRADDVVASFRDSGETVTVLGEVASIEGEQRVAYRGALDLRL
jgi:phosphoribosylformylglycinamidine cyclo-ligase